MNTNSALICYGVGIGWAIAGVFSQTIQIAGWIILGGIAIILTIFGVD